MAPGPERLDAPAAATPSGSCPGSPFFLAVDLFFSKIAACHRFTP